MGWIGRVVAVAIFGYVGYGAYDLHRGGYFSLPDLPNGAYPISFANGFRGVVEEMQVSDDQYASYPKWFRRLGLANPDRHFIGVPFDVPNWAKERWAKCLPATGDEQEQLEATMPEKYLENLKGARLDALCFVETDNDEKPVFRGLLYSVPK